MEIDLTTALGRLLRDTSLRDSFSRDPHAVAVEIGIRDCDYKTFVELSSVEIEHQSLTLLQKRFHEIQKLAPLTCGLVGTRAWGSFISHASAYWPEGHNRHVLDALGFCERISGRCRSELNRLQFALRKRRFAIHAVKNFKIGARERAALQILRRLDNGTITEYSVFLRF